jgi:hypothetical protein
MARFIRYTLSLILLIFIFVSLSEPLATFATESETVIVRGAIVPTTEIWIGQRVDLHIDVLARDGWAQIKGASNIDVPGAYLVRLETQGTRLSETLSGVLYSGQRYELLLFPQQGGTMTVPPIPVDVEVSHWGAQAEKMSLQTKTPALTFDVKIPPGAENLPAIISTTSLEAKQQWQPRQEDYQVGDAIKRSITLTASDISGMAFTPMAFPEMEGAGTYPDEPAVEDNYARGSLNGKRSESVTYVFEKNGVYELPEIIIPWWNISTKILEKIVLPGLTVNIAAAGGGTTSSVTYPSVNESRRTTPAILLIISIIMIIVFSIFWWYRSALTSRYRHWQHKRGQSEKAYFHRLAKACQSNDARDTYNALQAWLNKWQGDHCSVTLEQFLDSTGNEKLTKSATALEHKLFKKIASNNQQISWSGQELYLELVNSRKNLAASRLHKETSQPTLSPLNPH